MNRWVKADRREPPVSSDERRTWIHVYIPERVEAHPGAASMSPDAKRAIGTAMATYLGNGNYRLAGQQTATTERVTAWRKIGDGRPVSQELTTYAKAEIH